MTLVTEDDVRSTLRDQLDDAPDSKAQLAQRLLVAEPQLTKMLRRGRVSDRVAEALGYRRRVLFEPIV